MLVDGVGSCVEAGTEEDSESDGSTDPEEEAEAEAEAEADASTCRMFPSTAAGKTQRGIGECQHRVVRINESV